MNDKGGESLLNLGTDNPVHSARILWSFVGGDIANLLKGVTRLSAEEIVKLMQSWEQRATYRASLQQLVPFQGTKAPIPESAADHVKKIKEQAWFRNMEGQLGSAEFCILPANNLIAPLVLLDEEYVESLQSEYKSDSETDVVEFALPESSVVNIKGGVDPASLSVTLVSNLKTLLVSGLKMQDVPGIGLEVRFLVTSAAMQIVVSEVGGRFYLRNGIHRAFLLARKGIKEIPCILVQEKRPPAIVSSYPAFVPTILASGRPPLLVDFLDPELVLVAPMQRTHKVIRISALDFLVPID